jgi:hypothetical protein
MKELLLFPVISTDKKVGHYQQVYNRIKIHRLLQNYDVENIKNGNRFMKLL